MSVLKRNSVCFGGGVDICNTVVIRKPPEEEPVVEEPIEEAVEESQPEEPPAPPEPDLAEINEKRSLMLDQREQLLMEQQRELEALKEQYIEQGKEVILEAKRRAESIITTANENAQRITEEAELNREGVYIKAKAEGFQQGQKDGVDACLAAGRDILDEAKVYVDRINDEKAALFEKYEQDIYETVMAIANKVTLDSLKAKDSTVVKKLIKKAAKDFRGCERIKITLDQNGATEELAGDYEYLKELCGGIASVEVELLPDAEPGTVILDNGSEITDAGIQTQLRMIRELGSGKFRSKKNTEADE